MRIKQNKEYSGFIFERRDLSVMTVSIFPMGTANSTMDQTQ